jgi:hypothetical protein
LPWGQQEQEITYEIKLGKKEITLTFYSLPVTWCTYILTFNSCTLCPHCIYVFCIFLISGTYKIWTYITHGCVGRVIKCPLLSLLQSSMISITLNARCSVCYEQSSMLSITLNARCSVCYRAAWYT